MRRIQPMWRAGLLLVMLAGLPIALLVAAEIRELAREQTAIARAMADARQSQAAALAADLGDQLGRRLAHLAPPPGRSGRGSPFLAEELPWISQPFWIDREYRLGGTQLLASPGRVAELPLPLAQGTPEQVQQALAEAASAEFSTRQLAEAEAAYRRVLLLSAAPAVRARAAYGMARLAERGGRTAEADSLYRAVARLLGTDKAEDGVPYGLMAELRIVRLGGEAGAEGRLAPRIEAAVGPDEASAYLDYLRRMARESVGRGTQPPVQGLVAGQLWPAIRDREFRTPSWVVVGQGEGRRLFGIVGRAEVGYSGFQVDLDGIRKGLVREGLRRLDQTAMPDLAWGESDDDEVSSARLSAPLDALVVTVRWPPELLQSRLASLRRRSWTVLGILLSVVLAASVAIARGLARELAFARMQASFVAGVSHELKTPLTAIRIYAELLASGLSRDPGSAARTVIQESERLGRLIDRVLDFARIQRGTKTYNLQKIEPAVLAQDAMAIIQPTADEKGFRLHLDLPDTELPPVRADRDALLQVLLNLLNNAIAYSGDARDIALRLRSAGASARNVRIEVADRGPGIAPEHRRRIFQPFYRAVSPDGPGGSGLGLALVKEFTAAHGASVDVEHPPEGGATFVVHWPTWHAPEGGT
ncbi:MAG: HAMP domain-containing sensor histidine kinase [Candidatus Sericytochromatia bacterium]|nr:HAMP domain-containing sensor histidine kinase [Candidatus Sericytochromatia bacterium]